MASTNTPSSAINRRMNRLALNSTPRAATTPIRRANSAEPNSSRLSASGRRKATTPHARAALRALDQRRTALFTPGRARRRSLREQRESPRDTLRELALKLAPTSNRPHVSSSSSPEGDNTANATLTPVAEEEGWTDDDDDFPIEKPRFSLPLDRDDDDDRPLRPHRSSGLEDLDYTMGSVEIPRRAWTEEPLGRLDRGSLGSVRFSDFNLQSDDAGLDSEPFPLPVGDDETGGVVMEEDDIQRVDAEEARRQTLGRDSLFGPIEIPEAGNESTFVMAGVQSPERSPVRDSTVTEVIAGEDAPMDDDDDEGNEPLGLPDLEDDNGNMDDINDLIPSGDMDQTVQSPTANLTTAEIIAQRSAQRIARKADQGVKLKRPKKKISKYGIEYPSLPHGVVKRLAAVCAKSAGMGKAKISNDTLNAIMQATDWFFEQLGDDLQAYAKHAGRKTIDESDMITLMRRQRQTSLSTTPFALAQRHLPRELLQELRIPAPAPVKAPRKGPRSVGADGEEEVT